MTGSGRQPCHWAADAIPRCHCLCGACGWSMTRRGVATDYLIPMSSLHISRLPEVLVWQFLITPAIIKGYIRPALIISLFPVLLKLNMRVTCYHNTFGGSILPIAWHSYCYYISPLMLLQGLSSPLVLAYTVPSFVNMTNWQTHQYYCNKKYRLAKIMVVL